MCAEEHRARRDGRWPALTLLMDVRPRQHSFASCKKLLIILDLCEGRSCSCGRLVVASLCPVCVRVCVRGCVCVRACTGRRGQWAHGSGTCSEERGETWGWCFLGRVTPGRGLTLELAGRAVDAGSVAWCCLPLLSSAGERGRLGHQRP